MTNSTTSASQTYSADGRPEGTHSCAVPVVGQSCTWDVPFLDINTAGTAKATVGHPAEHEWIVEMNTEGRPIAPSYPVAPTGCTPDSLGAISLVDPSLHAFFPIAEKGHFKVHYAADVALAADAVASCTASGAAGATLIVGGAALDLKECANAATPGDAGKSVVLHCEGDQEVMDGCDSSVTVELSAHGVDWTHAGTGDASLADCSTPGKASYKLHLTFTPVE